MRVKLPPPGQRRENIEDRRAVMPPRPSHPDAVVRGLPQTPEELEAYRMRIAAHEAARVGQPLPPTNEWGFPNLPDDFQPGSGDPAGLESRRKMIWDRHLADKAALEELDRRLGALKKKAKKP